MGQTEQNGNGNWSETIGAGLRAEREKRGVSQSSLARRTGISQSAISRIEAGRETPSLERWSRLAAGLGLKPEVGLVPIGQAPSEEQHSAAARRRPPAENLELAAAWIDFREEIRGKARVAERARARTA